MSTRRISQHAGWADMRTIPRGPGGNPLCRQCGTETRGASRTFCNDVCVSAWKVKTQPGHVRRLVLRRDKGIFAGCGLDTIALREAFDNIKWFCRPVEPLTREEKDRLGSNINIFAWGDYHHGRALWLGFNPKRKSWWDADHVIPVVEGGGECDLSNYRTLCQPCHKKATRELAARRAAQRRTATP